MAQKRRVGVLFGGRSGEHEVSLVSAASVLRGLNRDKYDVIPIGITKEGRWVLPEAKLAGELSHTDLRRALADGAGVVPPPQPAPPAPPPGGARARGPRAPPCRSRSTSSSPSCTAPSAKTAPCRGCSSWRTCPTWARGGWGRRWGGAGGGGGGGG